MEKRVRSDAVRKDEIERNYIGRESDNGRSLENFGAESLGKDDFYE